MIAAADREGYVFGSPVGLAAIARLPIDEVVASLEKLSAPDLMSADLRANPANEGRRLEVVEGGWRLINYRKYRDLERQDDRRKIEADRKKRWRGLSRNVPESPSSESESESESEKRDIARFAPPTTEDAQAFFGKRKAGGCMEFLAFYESNGWKVGKNPMKNWKAAAAGWIMRNGEAHVR